MTDQEHKKPDMLDDMFVTARAQAPEPSADFMLAMQEMALAQQPRPSLAPARESWFAALRGSIGGWPGLAGLAMASAAGIWIGVAQPDSLLSATGLDTATLGAFGVDPISSFDLALLEG